MTNATTAAVPAPSPSSELPADSLPSPAVLLVDDNPKNLLVLQEVLKGLDADLASASSGQEALHWLAEHEAAAILLDVAMPGLDGFQTAKLIRLRPASQHTPILFVTAVALDEGARSKGYQLGAVDYLTKPLEPDVVRSKVTVFLTLYRQRQELEQMVAQRGRMERALQKLNEELEEHVRTRTAQLQESLKELEGFAYSVSHDLRAPLRAIDGFAQILLHEYLAQLPEKPRHYLQLVCDNTRQMGRLIDDLLRFSRAGRQSIEKGLVSPADLVRQCLDDLKPDYEGRHLEFLVGQLPPCWADGNLLKQVWFNLLSNAIKFTRQCERGRIEVGSDSNDGETVYYVRDNGVGFDSKYADKLFGVFQRLHPMEEYEGTGIGLALVQRIILRHGGRAWAQGALDAGATFSFTLGKDTPQEASGQQPSEQEQARRDSLCRG